MPPKNDIHNYALKLETVHRRLETAPISDTNRRFIKEFDRACFLEGIGKPRRIKLIETLVILAAKYLQRNFDLATRDDIRQVVMTVDAREDCSPWTKHSYKVILKKFYKWLAYGDEYRTQQEYPPLVAWIRAGLKEKDKPRIQASEILTEEEIRRLISAAEHPRDKAFLSMLYELGARIGEIGGLKIKDLTRDKYGYLVDLEGKTGHRTPRIVFTDPHLTHWLNAHPHKEDPSAPLWVMTGNRNKHQLMRYAAFRALVLRLVAKAGIKKRVHPHLFRHSRVTHLLMNRQINEAQAKVYFGWVPNSSVLSEYSHLISNDVNDTILQMHGIKTDTQQKSAFTPKQCPRCVTINDPESQFCHKCGGILDVQIALRLDEERKGGDDLMAALVKDPEVQKVLVKKIIAMGLKDELLSGMIKREGA